MFKWNTGNNKWIFLIYSVTIRLFINSVYASFSSQCLVSIHKGSFRWSSDTYTWFYYMGWSILEFKTYRMPYHLMLNIWLWQLWFWITKQRWGHFNRNLESLGSFSFQIKLSWIFTQNLRLMLKWCPKSRTWQLDHFTICTWHYLIEIKQHLNSSSILWLSWHLQI
jgi:hypothetical protein